MKIKLLLMLCVVSVFSLTDTHAIGSLAKRFNFDVKIASQKFKRGDFEGCRAKLDMAQTKYDKLDDSDKADATVVKSKKTLDGLNAKLVLKGYGPKSVEKAVGSAVESATKGKIGAITKKVGIPTASAKPPKSVRVNIDRFDKCVKNIQRYHKENWLSTAVTEVKKAEKVYNKIPQAYRALPNVAKNKSTYDDYAKRILNEDSSKKEAYAAATKEREAGYSFDADVQNVQWFLGMLEKGKKKEEIGFVTNISGFIKGYKESSAKAVAFMTKHKSRLEANKVGNRTEMTGSQIIDLISNRDTYYKNIMDIAVNFGLDAVIERLKRESQSIAKERKTYNGVIFKLKKADFKMAFEPVRDVVEYCKIANYPLPKAKLDLIDSYKAKQLDLINKASKVESFNKSKFPKTDSYMKKAAQKEGDVRDLKLIYAGLPSSASWKVHKNALGVPLYKSAVGIALYQGPGENYYRAYSVIYHKQYNGSGYEEIGAASNKQDFYIYKK